MQKGTRLKFRRCILGCQNNEHLFRFPKSKIDSNIWLDAIGMRPLENTSRYRICEKHFRKEMIGPSGSRLMLDAMPYLAPHHREQVRAGQKDDYISNTVLKKIKALKTEKEALAKHLEREEEYLTKSLSRELEQLREEKCKLEQSCEEDQECLVNKLMQKIEKLEAETLAKQNDLKQLRQEVLELENTLEQEQEFLVNKLWGSMDKLEAEMRSLTNLDQSISDPTIVSNTKNANEDSAGNLSINPQNLHSEVIRLKATLAQAQKETNEKMEQFAQKEKTLRHKNLCLQRKLDLEVVRNEALCREIAESKVSLEMKNASTISNAPHSESNSLPISSVATGVKQPLNRCNACGQILGRRTSVRLIKPAISKSLNVKSASQQSVTLTNQIPGNSNTINEKFS